MRYLYVTAMLLLVGNIAKAQDQYDAADNAQADLNGTARFVGMGGALSALGADITTMGTNPAGTALMRRSDASVSFGGQFTPNRGAMGFDASRASFDNAGVVFAFDMEDSGGLRNINFGVNYRKNRNFLGNATFNVGGLQSGELSQTNQIARLANSAFFDGGGSSWGMLADMSANNYEEGFEHDGILYDDGPETEPYYGVGSKAAYYERATYGNITQTDVNLSFNFDDCAFFGLAVGIYTMDKTRESFYQEQGVDDYIYDFTNWYYTRGSGFDIKLGGIVRPIADSPFRLGLSVHTPTWYRLRDANGSTLYMTYPGDTKATHLANRTSDEFSYNYRTPWKINASVGHTVGTWLALGAEYEWSDVSFAKYSNVGGGIDAEFMKANDNIRKMLRATHTVRLGLELKPIDNFSVRLGYNFVSSPFRMNDAYRLVSFYSNKTETDYTNWGAINRITFGLGYRFKGGYLDATYQHQRQSGDFYAFDDQLLVPTKISNNRNQLLVTLGFRF